LVPYHRKEKICVRKEIAMENRLPIIYLVDSAGVYLPLQDEIFPDKNISDVFFRNNALLAVWEITQISAVMGSCVCRVPVTNNER
jgi:acetyl-CoA carboxylase carboxyltransferase component